MIERIRTTPLTTIIKYLLTGGLVGLVNITIMTVSVAALHINAQIALIAAFTASTTIHFVMQRQFVWASEHGYQLAGAHQSARYMLMVGCAYGVTAVSLATVPSLLGVSVLPVYFFAIGVVTVINFVVFQNWIFHPPERSLRSVEQSPDGRP